MNPILRRVLIILITLIVPFFLMMSSIRILFTPLYMQVEYRMPGFPADPYGFTLQDRLHWSESRSNTCSIRPIFPTWQINASRMAHLSTMSAS